MVENGNKGICRYSEKRVVSEWGDKEYICVGKNPGKPCFGNRKCIYFKPSGKEKHE